MPPPGEPFRVMIVDDHPIVRMGLRSALEQDQDFAVAGDASDGLEAIEKARLLKPDVVIMDVLMPVLDGVEACRTIMEEHPGVRVLMLTASTEKDAVIDAIAAGATGYLQKQSGSQDLLEALRAVAQGHLRIPEEALMRTLSMVRDEMWTRTRRATSALTPRERELLTPFASGVPYASIAEAKGISPVTVRNTISRVQEKLGLENKQELVIWAVKNGLTQNS